MEQTVKSDWDTDKMSLSLHQDVGCRLPHLMSLEKCHIVPDAWPATRPEAITNREWPFRRAFRGFKWQIRFQSMYYFLLCTMFCTASTQDFFSCLFGNCFAHELYVFTEFSFPFVCNSIISFYKYSNTEEIASFSYKWFTDKLCSQNYQQ